MTSAGPLPRWGWIATTGGHSGAALRLARGDHTLLATDHCALLGKLLPFNTTTTTKSPTGALLEVRLAFRLATWLVLGFLTVTNEVAEFTLYHH